MRTLGQLRQLRERYRSELEEVHELIAQLVAQAELLRLQPAVAHASGELVRELVARVEGLGDLFAYQEQLGTDDWAKPGSSAQLSASGPAAEYPRGTDRSA
ncbi:MAG: hypothetical protein KIT31_30795 [Deltaproteobacteria bacterium]|nr:hypothetical protein [Deltaproteobacteria bacterium]